MRFVRITSTELVYSRLHTYEIPFPKRSQTTRPILVAIDFFKLAEKMGPEQRVIEGKRNGNRFQEDSLNVITRKIFAVIGCFQNKTTRGRALHPQLWHFIASWIQLCFRFYVTCARATNWPISP